MAAVPGWIQAFIDQQSAKIAALLGFSNVIQNVHITSKHIGNGAFAYGGPDGITIDPEQIQHDPYGRFDVEGALVHELTHVYMSTPGAVGEGNARDTALNEGLADFVRDKLGYANANSNPRKTDEQGKPLGSYQDTAAFYSWLFKNNPTQVQQTVDALQSGNDHFFQQVTGKTLGQLADAYKSGDKSPEAYQQATKSAQGPSPIWNPIDYFFGDTGGGGAGPSGSVTLTLPPPTASSGPSDAQARLHAWENLTNQWNIKQDPAITKLMQEGNKAGWTEQTFLWHLRQTQEYHDAFPYIQGTGMSEAAYVAQTKAYQTSAASYGVNLTPALQSVLFQRGISSTTASQRFQAESQLRTNQPLFDAFNRQRKSEGKPILSRGDMMSFILGEGNQNWYDDWNNANSRYAGNMAGVTFDNKAQEYTSVGRNVVKEVAGLGLSQSAERSGYQKLAQQLKTSLPLSRIQKFGLTKQDLVELEFGGKRQASVAATVQSILANESNLEDQSNKAMGIGGIQPGKNSQGSQQSFAQA